MENMRIRPFLVTAVCLMSAVVLACGCGKKTSKTEEGMELLAALDYEGAWSAFDMAERGGENPRLIARGRGIAQMGQSNYEEAITCFEDALACSNGFVENIDIDVNYYIGAAYMKLQDPANAEAVYTAIVNIDPQEDALFYRGVARLAQQKYDAAKEDFDRLIAKNQGDCDRLLDIHQALMEYGYRTEGMEYLQMALASADGDLSNFDRGRIYYYMGDYQQAAVALENARQAQDDADSSLYLGLSYEAVGEYNYASNVYESYLARDEQNAAMYNQLALCKMQMKDYQGALSCIEAGIQTGDMSIMQNLLFNEIVCNEHLGEFQRAKTLLAGYLNTYPDDPAALREQKFLATR